MSSWCDVMWGLLLQYYYYLDKMLLWRQSPSSTNTSIADRGCWERGNWVKMMTRHGGTFFIYLSYHRSMDRHNYCQTLVLMENTQNIMTFNKLKFENFTRGEVSQLLTRRHGIKDHSPGPQTRHRHLKQNIPSFCKNCYSSVKICILCCQMFLSIKTSNTLLCVLIFRVSVSARCSSLFYCDNIRTIIHKI